MVPGFRHLISTNVRSMASYPYIENATNMVDISDIELAFPGAFFLVRYLPFCRNLRLTIHDEVGSGIFSRCRTAAKRQWRCYASIFMLTAGSRKTRSVSSHFPSNDNFSLTKYQFSQPRHRPISAPPPNYRRSESFTS